MRWILGFIFHKMAFGLLSVLFPLYITQIVDGGTLASWGVVTATATFLAIPFSFIWGFVCDAANRYSIFVLLSFSTVTVLLFFLSSTTDLFLFWLLYALIALFQVAYETPKNVLIAETYSYEKWKKGFALYAVWTELGWVSGLLLGFVLVFLGFSYMTLLAVSVILSLLSFLFSIFLVKDPVMFFERRFRRIEKAVSLVQKGAILLSRGNLTADTAMELRKEKVFPFCAGLVMFSLATSVFFIPLPVYFAKIINFETGIIFGLFLLNSLGCLFGYAFTLRKHHSINSTESLRKATLFRSLLMLSAFLIGGLPFFGVITLLIAALASMGIAYAFYSICVLSISMDIIPKGRVGLFSALIGVGSAIGCFIGPVIAENLGFQPIFLLSSFFCFLSFLAFLRFE